MPTTSLKPRPVTPDKPEEEDVGRPLRQFKFVNRTRYTILLAWGWDPLITELDPDYTIEPYTSQIVMPETPQEKFIWMASSEWGIEAERQAGSETFGYTATDRIMAIAAVSSSATDVLSAPPVDVGGTLDMSRIIDTQEAAERDTIIGKLEADPVNRLRIKNTGRFYLGDGTSPVTERFLASSLEELTDNFPDDYAGAAAAPSTYPLGVSLFRDTDGVGGWPSSSGLVITIRRTGAASSLQLYSDNGTSAVYWRSGLAGDTWTTFLQFANVTFVNNLISTVTANYQAADISVRDLAFAYTDAMLAVVSPSTTAGWSDTNAVKYRVSKNKRVTLEGQVKNTSGAVKTPPNIIFMVGASYRPATTQIFRAPQFSTANGWVASMAALYLNPAGEFGIISQNVPIDNEINFGGIGWVAP